jgi:hypothetical protein
MSARASESHASKPARARASAIGSSDRWQGVPFPLSSADYGGHVAPVAPPLAGDDRTSSHAEADPWPPVVASLNTIDLSTVAVDDVPERKWIVSNLIPARNVTDISGDGGLGKSLLASHCSRFSSASP